MTKTAPRILRAIKAESVRAVYFKQRRRMPRTPRIHRPDDYDELEDTHGDSVRVAYQTARAIPVKRPDAEDVVENDEPDADQPNEYQEDQHISGPRDRGIVSGKHAVLRNGLAYAPSSAPDRVKNAVWAANSLRRKPYIWGGGHGSFHDYGYDCSGSVSYALHAAGVIAAPMPSNELMYYGERGPGRWITIYSRPGHTFAVIAGLRFDTTDLDRGSNVGPRWYSDGRNTRGYVARHPVGL